MKLKKIVFKVNLNKNKILILIINRKSTPNKTKANFLYKVTWKKFKMKTTKVKSPKFKIKSNYPFPAFLKTDLMSIKPEKATIIKTDPIILFISRKSNNFK
jgi:hypothetical protein